MAAPASDRPARRQLVNAIAAGRVAQQVDPIRVDVLYRDHVLDEPAEQAVNVILMPEVPGIGLRSRSEVNAFRQGV